jgi:hypothetical protein
VGGISRVQIAPCTSPSHRQVERTTPRFRCPRDFSSSSISYVLQGGWIPNGLLQGDNLSLQDAQGIDDRKLSSRNWRLWFSGEILPRRGVNWLRRRPNFSRSHKLQPKKVRILLHVKGQVLTSSVKYPLPVLPNVSMANTSPSSILSRFLFLIKGTCLPP